MRQINKEDPDLDYSFDNDLNVKESQGEIKALASKKRSTRSYKIGYYLNLLGSVQQGEGRSLINAIAESEELEIFKTELVRDLIDARWFKFAKQVYMIGICFHLIYVITISMYIRVTYMGAKISEIPSQGFLIAVGICLIFPTIYDGAQLWKRGRMYFKDFWNYVDIFHIFGGYFNIYL